MRVSCSHFGFIALLAGLGGAGCSEHRAPGQKPGQSAQGIVRIPCTTTQDCRARGGACNQGQCTAANECATDADCGAREVCTLDTNFGGLCAPPAATPTPMPPWSCAADSDCPTAQVCTRGSCDVPQTVTPTVTPGCTTDADCQNGERCQSGACAPGVGCRADTDCASGEICRADQVCVPNPWACTTDADCDARGGYVCTNGECGTASSHGCNSQNCPCDVIAQNCAFGMRCYPFGPRVTDGQCFIPGARAEGDACVEPPFGEPESCGTGLVCVFAAEEDPAGICYSLCATDSDCSGGNVCRTITEPSSGLRADWGLCAAPPPPPPPPVCDALAQDCSGSGDLCAPVDIGSNVCVPAGRGAEGSACTAASDCSTGLACVAEAGATPTTQFWTLLQAYIDRGGGTCKALCRPGPACAGGQSCDPISLSSTGDTRTDVGVCH